jgi:peptidoglycan hydrolase CwlO-like protein
VVSEHRRKRLRIAGQILLYVLVVGYLVVILADLSSLRSNISAMAGDISSLQSDVNSIQSDVSSIQNDVSAIADDLDDLSNDGNSDAGKSVSEQRRSRPRSAKLAAWHSHRSHRLKGRLVSVVGANPVR